MDSRWNRRVIRKTLFRLNSRSSKTAWLYETDNYCRRRFDVIVSTKMAKNVGTGQLTIIKSRRQNIKCPCRLNRKYGSEIVKLLANGRRKGLQWSMTSAEPCAQQSFLRRECLDNAVSLTANTQDDSVQDINIKGCRQRQDLSSWCSF